MTRTRHRTAARVRLAGFCGAALMMLAAAIAQGQTKITKARSVGGIFEAPDGGMIVFCGQRYRTAEYVTSADAKGKQWGKPQRLARFGSAAQTADGTIYVASYAGRGFVLDSITPDKDGWKVRQDVGTIYTIPFKGEVIGPVVRLVVATVGGKERLWASCGWREDERVGQRKASTTRFMVFQASPDKRTFTKSWEDKSGFVENVSQSVLAPWGDRLALYCPQHYVCGLMVYDGKSWTPREKFFDYGRTVSGWIGGYGSPMPQMVSTANGCLHVGQYVLGTGTASGGTYLLTVSPSGKVSHLEIGGKSEVVQFALADGADVLLGMRYTVIERIEDMENTYQSFYAVRCRSSEGGGVCKKVGKESAVTQRQTLKGAMVVVGGAKVGGELKVAYVDEGTLYFAVVPAPGKP